jgi:hypothetical protein
MAAVVVQFPSARMRAFQRSPIKGIEVLSEKLVKIEQTRLRSIGKIPRRLDPHHAAI